MPARFVTTSLVTKRAGIAARFVTLVTKRAVVTKRAATCFYNNYDDYIIRLTNRPVRQLGVAAKYKEFTGEFTALGGIKFKSHCCLPGQKGH